MVSYGEHLKKILSQTVESYYLLKEIQDKPGDLEILKKEMLLSVQENHTSHVQNQCMDVSYITIYDYCDF